MVQLYNQENKEIDLIVLQKTVDQIKLIPSFHWTHDKLFKTETLTKQCWLNSISNNCYDSSSGLTKHQKLLNHILFEKKKKKKKKNFSINKYWLNYTNI